MTKQTLADLEKTYTEWRTENDYESMSADELQCEIAVNAASCMFAGAWEAAQPHLEWLQSYIEQWNEAVENS